MSKPKQRARPAAKPRGRRKFFITIAVVLAVGIAAAVTLLRGAGGSFDKLNGRWLRPDGGYVLEIRSVDASGKIDIAGTMQIITFVVEQWVRQCPEQWLWLHRRWRT